MGSSVAERVLFIDIKKETQENHILYFPKFGVALFEKNRYIYMCLNSLNDFQRTFMKCRIHNA